jgi:hypothetical protein
MIHVVLTRHQGMIRSITIRGHAGSDVYGKDLVCAAVSAIAFGAGNALDELGSDCECSAGNNRIEFAVRTEDATTQTILSTVMIQLETVHEGNSEFIDIRKMEV